MNELKADSLCPRFSADLLRIAAPRPRKTNCLLLELQLPLIGHDV